MIRQTAIINQLIRTLTACQALLNSRFRPDVHVCSIAKLRRVSRL